MKKNKKFKKNAPKPTPVHAEILQRGRAGDAARRLSRTPVSAEILSPLNMGFLNAATITPGPHINHIQLIVVGGGGIGAYMVQHLGRLMHVLYQMDTKVHMTICDPDEVKEENIGRQLFCKAEIGVPKAEALMRRYGQAWGLDVSSYVGKFEESIVIGAGLTVLVGCVDNAEGRKALHKTLQHNPVIVDEENIPKFWWLDCGNLKDTGRVLLGTAYGYEQVKGAFPTDKLCIALPSPGLQSPGLLVAQPEELLDSRMSCAQMAAANLQSLNINARIAAEGADMLTRLLITRDLKRYACEVNVAAGVVRSYYATPDEVSQSIHKPVGYLKEPPDPKQFIRYDAETGTLFADLLGGLQQQGV